MLDFEVERCTRHCAESGRALTAGEEIYSVLLSERGAVKRLDYAIEVWHGPPEKALAWWKSKIPLADQTTPKLAPSDALLQFFVELEQSVDKADVRYVLALLLIRRRIFRLEDQIRDEQGRDVMVLYCGRNETTYDVPIVVPDDARIVQIQDQLAELLFTSGVKPAAASTSSASTSA